MKTVNPYAVPGVFHRPRYNAKKYYKGDDMTELKECLLVVAAYVTQAYERDINEVLSRSKKRVDSEPRQAIMYIMKYRCDYGWSAIGDVMGFDHSSVIFGVQAAKNMIDTDRDYKKRLKGIIEQLQLEYPQLIVVGESL